MVSVKVDLYCDSGEPRVIFEGLMKQSIPAQKRNMRFHPRARPETLSSNPLMRCGTDYAFFVNDRPVIGIERKSMRDAVLSIITYRGRPRNKIFRQLETIKVFPIRILLLEGRLPPDMLQFEPVLYGVQYWCLRNGVFVFHTVNMVGTYIALKVIYRRLKATDQT